MLNNRVAIITGGSSGIGKAIALKLATNKCNIVVNYIGESSKDDCDKTITELENLGIKAIPAVGDVSNIDDCKKIVDIAMKAFGKLDIVVNNAGITNDKLILRMTSDDFKRVIDVNLTGSFNMIKSAARSLMKSGSGRIINISSVIGLMGNMGQSNYAASKSGLFGLTKSVAKEFASRNITANSVCPGFISSAMTAKLSDDVITEYKKLIPLKRLGTSEDVANVCLFLASDLAAYVTGQEIAVDGGMVM